MSRLLFVTLLLLATAANAQYSPDLIDGPTIAEGTYTLTFDCTEFIDPGWEIRENGLLISSACHQATPKSMTFPNKPYGTYTYTMDWCFYEAESQTTFCLGDLYGQAPNPHTVTVVPAAIEPAPNLTSSTEPMSLPDNASVSSRGELQIAIPIDVPAGVNGLQPNLTLTYMDNRRLPADQYPSFVGNGWDLSGITSIRVCDVSAGTYCLGDTALVDDNSPLPGTAYRPVNNPNIRIVEQDAGGGQKWFEMHAGDKVYNFGVDAISRGTIGTHNYWFLQSVTDAFGNTMTVSYAKEPGTTQPYPTNIDYGGYSVEFAYMSRPGNTINGNAALLLHTIRSFVNGTQTNEYRLINETINSIARLSDVQFCGYDINGLNPECLPSTHFDWFTPPAAEADFRIGVSKITDGLGVDTVIDRLRSDDTSFPYFYENPFDFTISDTDLFNIVFSSPFIEQSNDLPWAVVSLSRDSNAGPVLETEYSYYISPIFNLLQRKKLPDGTYSYTARDIRSGYAGYGGNEIAYQARYTGIYGDPGSKRLSESYINRHDLTVTHSDYVNHYVKDVINYIVDDNGDLQGATMQHNLPTWDANNGVITQMVNTVTTGYGLDANGAIVNVDKTTETTLTYQHDLSNWIIGYVNNQQVVVSDVPGEAGAVTLNSTRVRFGNSLQTSSSTRLSNDANLAVITQTGFDSHGNVDSLTVSGPDFVSRTSQFQNYQDDRYPLTALDALNHSTTVDSIDKRFGAVKSVTDANQQTTETLRDNFGRVEKITLANGTEVTYDYVPCNMTCGSVQGVYVAYQVITEVQHSNPLVTISGAPSTTTSYDQLGRVIQVQQDGFGVGENIYVDTVYDDLGRIFKRSLPYKSGTPVFAQFDYDLYGRQILATNPDGSKTDITYQQTASGYITTTTQTIKRGANQKTQVRIEEFNSLGQLVKTTDAAGSTDEVVTEYDYDHLGNKDWIRIDGNNNTIVQTDYDLAGLPESISDPNTGLVLFDYDALGQVKQQTDARGIVTDFSYDLLGRLTQRIDDLGGANQAANSWIYDQNSKIGTLSSRSGPGFSEVYNYNSDIQLSSIQTHISVNSIDRTYNTSFTYDDYGRQETQTFPSGLTTYNHYNDRGYADSLHQDNYAGQLLSQVNAMDHFGNVTQSTLGNGVVTNRSYDPNTGYLNSIVTGTSGAIQNNDYEWWSNGTLYQRSNLNTGASETFTYDGLNRLNNATAITPWGNRSLNYDYDNLGNLLCKSEVTSCNGPSDYTYDYSTNSNKPHQLDSVVINGVTHAYNYDASGNMTADDAAGTENDKTVTYNAIGKPIDIVKGDVANPGARDQFQYGPDGERFYKQSINKRIGIVMVSDITVIWPRPTLDQTLYLWGGSFEVVIPAEGVTTDIEKTHLGSVTHIREVTLTSSTSRFEYLHTDHLGSVEAITNQNGVVLGTNYFDPFGDRRNTNWTGTGTAPNMDFQNVHTNRGYTGHEQLDGTGLIHMNGRVYDPEIGRFMSADPVVQAPTFSQSYNRYSYVWNNPLGATDPSGYSCTDACRDWVNEMEGYWMVQAHEQELAMLETSINVEAAALREAGFGQQAAELWASWDLMAMGFTASGSPWVNGVIAGQIGGWIEKGRQRKALRAAKRAIRKQKQQQKQLDTLLTNVTIDVNQINGSEDLDLLEGLLSQLIEDEDVSTGAVLVAYLNTLNKLSARRGMDNSSIAGRRAGLNALMIEHMERLQLQVVGSVSAVSLGFASLGLGVEALAASETTDILLAQGRAACVAGLIICGSASTDSVILKVSSKVVEDLVRREEIVRTINALRSLKNLFGLK